MTPTDTLETSIKKPFRRVNRAALFFLLVALLLASGAIWNGIVHGTPSSTENTSLTSHQPLSAQDFNLYKQKYLDLLAETDARTTLATLREEVSTNQELAGSCHPLAHEIGRTVYGAQKDFAGALSQQDEICNSGYLHGVIEAHFSESEDVLAEIPKTCEGFSQESYLGWQCLHGIGHGLMYFTGQDLPRSLELCDELPLQARSICANGVFMDNFNTDQVLHPSRFLKADDPSYPCAEQAERHKPDCYTYAPTYYLAQHPGKYSDALEWCTTVENEFIDSCLWGVGSQTVKENSKTPEFAIQICEASMAAQSSSCIEGALNLLALHHGSPEPVRELCEKLPQHAATCTKSLNELSRLFTEE
jgi:hypothetical protein